MSNVRTLQRAPSHGCRSVHVIICTSSLRFFLAVVASQTLTCYTSSTACTSTSVSLTGTRTAGQCCLNRGGKSYRIGTSTTCTLCVGKCWTFFVLSLCSSPRLCYSIRVLSIPQLHRTVHHRIPEGRVAAHRILRICERNVQRNALCFVQCPGQ